MAQLQRTLALAGAALSGAPAALALASQQDPLRLNLPPVLGTSSLPNAGALRMLGALYLQAELEYAGIIPVAEALAENRNELFVTDRGAAAKLDTFARQRRDGWDERQRNLIFTRVFGLGGERINSSGNSLGGPTGNSAFQQLMANLCLRIRHHGRQFLPRRPASVEASVRRAAVDLLANLNPRQQGNTLAAARRIQQQLVQAIDLLNDPGIGALVGGRGMWDTLRKILGAETPDLGRYVNRGQSGLRLFHWLADALPRLGTTPTPVPPLLLAGSPAFTWADTWLVATGIES